MQLRDADVFRMDVGCSSSAVGERAPTIDDVFSRIVLNVEAEETMGHPTILFRLQDGYTARFSTIRREDNELERVFIARAVNELAPRIGTLFADIVLIDVPDADFID